MSSDLRELVALHALDLLDPDDLAVVEAAIAASPKLAAELRSLRQAAHQLSSLAEATKPPPLVGARLLTTVGGGRFERFAAQVATIFDLTLARAREVLGLIDRPSSWVQALPNVGLIHFAGGPRCATADCGVVRVAAGSQFPLHTHRGDEMSVIVAGTVRISDGARHLPGDEVRGEAGTSHALTAEGDEDLILLARAFNGIELARVPQP